MENYKTKNLIYILFIVYNKNKLSQKFKINI